MRLAVAGGGHVGLATAVGFARLGHEVDLIEVDPDRVSILQRGEIPFREPAIAEALPSLLGSGTLRVHERYPDVLDVEYGFVCVDTRPGLGGVLDNRNVVAAARSLAAVMSPAALLVLRSTVQPGTARELATMLQDEGLTRTVLTNPEFLREGHALVDFEQASRPRVIGGEDRDAVEALSGLYAFDPEPALLMDSTSAELAKLGANAALALRVAMANELASAACAVEADIDAVLRAVGSDPRIGAEYLQPGAGFGGPCLPKDLNAFRVVLRAREAAPSSVFDAAAQSNDAAIEVLAGRPAMLGYRPPARICVVGVAFKPGSDSIIRSPGINLVHRLLDCGYRVGVCDPVAEPAARRVLGSRVEYVSNVSRRWDVLFDLHRLAAAADFPAQVTVIDALGRIAASPGVRNARSA